MRHHQALIWRKTRVAKKASRSASSFFGQSSMKPVRTRGAAKHTFDHEFYRVDLIDAETLHVTLKSFSEIDGKDLPTWYVSFKDGKIKYRDAELYEDTLDNAGAGRYILDEQLVPPTIRSECERLFKAKTFVG